MTGSRHPKDLPFIVHWLIFGVAALFLGGFIAWSLYQECANIDTAERGRLSAHAKIIDENMVRQLDSINQMLAGIRNDLVRREKQADGMQRASRRMAAMADAMSGVRFIAVLDAQGKIVAANQEEFTGQDFSHRDYFQMPQRNPGPATLYVSPPFKNASGIFTMSLSRAIIAPDGRFAGVVMASLEPEEFRVLMNSVRYVPDMQVSLMHGDGGVFMAIPEQEGRVGTDMAAKPAPFFNRHIGSGQVASVMGRVVSATGEARVMALHTSQPAALRMNKPMVIAISRNLPAIFADWRREAWQQGGLFGVLVLISGAGLFAYQRRQRSYNRFVARYETEQQKITERLKLATEAAGMGVWEYDLVSGKQYWDDSMFAIYGVTPEEFTGDYAAWWSRLLPEDAAEVEAAVKSTLEQGKSYDICFRIRRGDGRVRVIHALARVHFDESGKAVRVVGTNEDITERKQAERALRESEARFRNLVETTSDWVWEIDENAVYTYTSPQIHDILGFEVAEIIGKTPFDHMPTEEAKRVADIFGPMAAARTAFTNFENINLHKDGHPVVLETSGVPVIDTEGKFCGYRGIDRDISGRKKYEEELKRSNIELEQFGYAISHDMRQPLRMISSYLQLLEMSLDGQLDSEKRSYFDFAIEGAKRIDQMLVALLEYSRVGRMGEPLTWIESRAVLDEALQFLQSAIAEAQARLVITGDWPRIFADHDEIQRLIQNLIGNAVKFRVAGRIPEIIISSEVLRNEWRLCVADNGVGIIPDQIKRLFQVFQRLQLRTAYEGNGVGLALCRKIAEHHQGRIWAESAGEGQGSRFCVVLPVPPQLT